MLFDLGWSEILLIGVVALVFIGPKDLPKAMRLAGYWVRKARSLSREFQSSIDQMIREAELDDMRQQLKKASEFDLDREFHNTIDPTGSLSESLKSPELPSFSPAQELPAPRVTDGIAGGVEGASEAATGAAAAREPAHSDPAAAAPGSAAPEAGKPPPRAGDPPGTGGHDPTAVAVEIVPPRP
jgi:sec-independent protein translocase protein TatB